MINLSEYIPTSSFHAPGDMIPLTVYMFQSGKNLVVIYMQVGDICLIEIALDAVNVVECTIVSIRSNGAL
jgi:hypothetical protein